MSTDFYSICHSLYWDNMQHQSYWFAHITYIMLCTTFGKLIFSFQCFGLCRMSTLRSCALRSRLAGLLLTQSCQYVGRWSTLSSASTAVQDMSWQCFFLKALLTQRLHSYHVGRRNLSHIERNVKLDNNILIKLFMLMTECIIFCLIVVKYFIHTFARTVKISTTVEGIVFYSPGIYMLE